MVIQLQDMRLKSLNISGESGRSVTSKDDTVTAKFIKIDSAYTSSGGYNLDVSNPENASAA